MLKQELRQVYLQLRQRLTADEKERLENLLFQQVLSIDFSKFSYVHIFLPILKFNEINTFKLIEILQLEFPQLKIIVPKIEKNTLKMSHIQLVSTNLIKENSWGIPEPMNHDEVNPSEIDLVFVPLVIADKLGNRVGYGKGYYDYFLKEVRTDCKKVGLSLFEPIDQITDRHANDVKLDHLVTPTNFLFFGG